MARVVDLLGRPAAVYRIYADEGAVLLYVGCTVNVEHRVRESADCCGRVRKPISAIKVSHYSSWEQAITAETRAIYNEGSLLNNRRRGRELVEEVPPPVRVEWYGYDRGRLYRLSDTDCAGVELAAAGACLQLAQARYNAAVAACEAAERELTKVCAS